MNLVNQVLHLRFLLRDDINNLRICRLIRNEVANSNTVRMCFHVFRDDILKSIDEVGCCHISKIVAHTLDKTNATTTEYAFVNLTTHHSTISDFDYIVRCRVVLVRVLLAKRFLLVFESKWRQDLRKDIKTANVFSTLECSFIHTRICSKKVHRLSWCKTDIFACE